MANTTTIDESALEERHTTDSRTLLVHYDWMKACLSSCASLLVGPGLGKVFREHIGIVTCRAVHSHEPRPYRSRFQRQNISVVRLYSSLACADRGSCLRC
jgi:hypothetical protein